MKAQRKTGVGFAAVFGLAAMVSAGTVTIDGKSGASINVTSATCKSNSVTVNWTMNQGGGNWRFYYGTTDVAAPSTTGWGTTVTPSSKSLTVNGLTAGTKYYALVAGWEGGVSSRAGSWAHLTFTTDAASAVLDRTFVTLQPVTGYDAFGRRLGRIPSSTATFSSQQGAQVQIQR